MLLLAGCGCLRVVQNVKKTLLVYFFVMYKILYISFGNFVLGTCDLLLGLVMLGCKDILSCDSRKKKMKKKNLQPRFKNAAIVSPNVVESEVYSRVFFTNAAIGLACNRGSKCNSKRVYSHIFKNTAIDPFFSYIGRNYRSEALAAVINTAQSWAIVTFFKNTALGWVLQLRF